MIITAGEYKDMGFICPEGQEDVLEKYIKRAEIIVTALAQGAISLPSMEEPAREYVRQAVALEANALYKKDNAENIPSEKVSLGDLSYSSGAKAEPAPEVSQAVIKLLKAAGCFRGRGITEVIE